MSALVRLKEKIEAWKVNYEALKAENVALKVELASTSGSTSNHEELEAEITALKQEIMEKDAEIEKIVEQVETLLA